MTEVLYSLVEETNDDRRISVAGVLKKLGVSTSGYYDWRERVPSQQEERKKN